MNDRGYLLKVLHLGAVPKAITVLLTLLTYPLMVRSLGATEYGLVVYTTAWIAVVEGFADGGVSSAAGKGIASVRGTSPGGVRAALAAWSKIQMRMAFVGAPALLAAITALVLTSTEMAVSWQLGVVLAAATWVGIALMFIRAALRSSLAFVELAVIDTGASFLRSAGFVVVAMMFPTALGLAWAKLVTALTTSLAAFVLLRWSLGRKYPEDPTGLQEPAIQARHALRDSTVFLGLRFSMRAFQAFPLIIVGRVLGADVVGIIGAFRTVADMAAYPFSAAGVALKVRAQEIRIRGERAVIQYWDLLFRLLVYALAGAALFLLASPYIARILLPDATLAPRLFSLLTLALLARSAAELFAPASDYVGALRGRLILLSLAAILQLPLIAIGAIYYDAIGAVIALSISHLILVIGYVVIAERAFFETHRYIVKRHVYFAAAVLLFLAAGCWALLPQGYGLLSCFTFLTIAFLAFYLQPELRRNYLTLRALEFT